MIKLYALKQSRAYRIAWLLELLALDYELEIIERDKETFLAPAILKKIHPLGKSPVLQDGSLTLAESGAIVEYLLARHNPTQQFKPTPESDDYPNYLYWFHYAEGSLMPLLVMSLVFNRIEQRKVPFFVKPIVQKIVDSVKGSYLTPQLKLHLDHIEQQLSGKQWFLGETLSGAGIMMGFPLQALVKKGWKVIQIFRRMSLALRKIPLMCVQSKKSASLLYNQIN
ncbi:glutathione S-transferase [Mannheimia varigena]|uniref:glutathione S-transferase n=1 Tax=Mannheimia varigena TaxID=85404 RepID=UPI001F3AA7F8|nr:glutathione S-transferase [Mannheimia varigena]